MINPRSMCSLVLLTDVLYDQLLDVFHNGARILVDLVAQHVGQKHLNRETIAEVHCQVKFVVFRYNLIILGLGVFNVLEMLLQEALDRVVRFEEAYYFFVLNLRESNWVAFNAHELLASPLNAVAYLVAGNQVGHGSHELLIQRGVEGYVKQTNVLHHHVQVKRNYAEIDQVVFSYVLLLRWSVYYAVNDQLKDLRVLGGDCLSNSQLVLDRERESLRRGVVNVASRVGCGVYLHLLQ
jgi:hypothetical protein